MKKKEPKEDSISLADLIFTIALVVVGIAFLLMLIMGCGGDLTRTNPLDPQNPENQKSKGK